MLVILAISWAHNGFVAKPVPEIVRVILEERNRPAGKATIYSSPGSSEAATHWDERGQGHLQGNKAPRMSVASIGNDGKVKIEAVKV